MLKQLSEMKTPTSCQLCHMGHMHQHVVTITRWMDVDLVLVPGVAVSVCDICGAVIQNDAVEQWISTLLDESERARTSKQRLIEGLLILPVTRGMPN